MKILIDAGHNFSGGDTGSQGNGLREQDVTFEVAQILGASLNKNGIEVVYTRPTKETNIGKDVSSSINGRIKIANENKVNLVISLHCDSNKDSEPKGAHICVYKKGNEATKLAEKIIPNLLSLNLTGRSETIKERRDLGILKHTAAPAILIEMGFITNPDNADIFKNKKDLLAAAIAKGIFEYLNIIPKEKPKPANTGDTIVQLYKVTASRLNVREKPNTNAPIIAEFIKDDIVYEFGQENGWVKIKTEDGRWGWVSKTYLIVYQENPKKEEPKQEPKEPPKTEVKTDTITGIYKVTASKLNVRERPTTDSKIIGEFVKDDLVYEFEKTNGWVRIKTAGGQWGWVSTAYLVPYKESPSNTYYTYKKVDGVHIAEVDPLKIFGAIVNKAGNKVEYENCINGGYFGWNNVARTDTYTNGHLVNDGKILANIMTHGKPVTTICVFFDGVVQIKPIADISLERGLKFAISGAGIYPQDETSKEGFTGAFADIKRSAPRSLIGYNPEKNKIFLMSANNLDIVASQNLFKKHGISKGITLDGGGSTMFKCGDYKITTSRVINNIVGW